MFAQNWNFHVLNNKQSRCYHIETFVILLLESQLISSASVNFTSFFIAHLSFSTGCGSTLIPSRVSFNCWKHFTRLFHDSKEIFLGTSNVNCCNPIWIQTVSGSVGVWRVAVVETAICASKQCHSQHSLPSLLINVLSLYWSMNNRCECITNWGSSSINVDHLRNAKAS